MEEKILRQDDGVVLTIDDNWDYVDCVGIDIPDDVEKLILGPVGVSKINYRLRDVLKCFPQVKEIEILDNVVDVEISNFMFPNVRYVSSQNNRYFSHQALLRKYTDGTYLLNAFCLEESEKLEFGPEFEDIFIYNYALEGCRSEYIFRSDILRMSKNEICFRGSSVMLKPCMDGVFLGGKYVLWIDDSDMIVFPPEAERLLSSEQYYNSIVENCVIHRMDQLELLPYTYFERLTILGTPMLESKKTELASLNIKNFYVSPDHPYYKTIDGVLYTKDGSKLILCPGEKSGCLNIPEGVVEIGDKAFADTILESVSFPDSLVRIGRDAFYMSRIKEVNFGCGVRIIGSQAFSNCLCLKKVNMPGSVVKIEDGAFSNCAGLCEVVLNDGLLEIGECAFSGCDALPFLIIPKTVSLFENGQIEQIGTIVFEGNLIPDDFLETTFSTNKQRMEEGPIVRIGNKKGETVILPRTMTYSAFDTIKEKTFVDQLFDPDFKDEIPDMSMSQELREDLIIDMWGTFQNEFLRGKYLFDVRNKAKDVCERLLGSGEEDRLFALLRTGIVPRKVLIDFLPEIPQDKVELRATILQASEEKSKTETLIL